MEQNTNVVENKEIVQEKNIETQQTETNTQVETQQEINWKKFREAREMDRKAKEASERLALQKTAEAEALKAAMEAILNKPSNQSNNQDEDETEDQKIEKKVNAALSAREQQLKAERERQEREEFPQKLATTYNDFNQVCTPDNLDYLEYHYPEVATPFKHMPDGYEKWAAVYKAVKRFVPNTDSKKDQKKAEKNFNKPQSMATSGVTQTGDTPPMQLDDKRRADNWQRMQRVMKGGR